MHRSRFFAAPWAKQVAIWGNSSFIAQVQRGTIAITTGNTSNTATITAADTTCSVVMWGGWDSASTDSSLNQVIPRLTLTNSTTVTANINTATTADFNIRWEVISFQPSVVKSLQRGSITLSAQASNTATIAAVNLGKAILFYGGNTSSLTVMQANTNATLLELTNSTTLTARNGGASGTLVFPYQVLEFY